MEHDTDTILAGIRQVVQRRLKLERPIDPGTEIGADLQLDSIQQFTLIVELENHFQICFDPGDEQELATVQDLIELIQARLPAGAAVEA